MRPPEKPDFDAVDAIEHAWRRERPETPVRSIGVISRVWHAAKLLGDDRRRTLAALGVDQATLDLLSTLRRAGPPYRMTPAQLAEQCLVSAGAISQRVVRAEADGLVHVERTASGRRTRHVELSARGHHVVEVTVDRLLTHEQELLDDLSDEQQERLADLLRVLLAGLRTRLGAPDEPGQVGDQR
ncbi:MarR family winged helix-turn-helix transcriptional regulator [Streptoalloteichus hindustanus]|uniref:DNA-binding transcriptional regulator, MarR family n=1 Tax=Streptoalloteichus hindustanus TaxID=2017 RepID=A0A1M5GTS8_STRHI|nr:MarR family transcriptional regulator [Streptoalloteichus hindustanus]SHG07077.1 DNA-binding transcriptional regulator, MarR family [Streptoalloteichus hindustanus]